MQYGTLALQALCLRGGQASQNDIAQDVGLPVERLGPILAGLHHNGYLVRNFQPGDTQLVLTEEGRRWATTRGQSAAPAAGTPKPQAPRPAAPAPAPTPSAAPTPSRPMTSNTLRLTPKSDRPIAPPAPVPAPPAPVPPPVAVEPPPPEPLAAEPPPAPVAAAPEDTAVQEGVEPAPARRRPGRPRKTPAAEGRAADSAAASDGEPAPPRRRGRPRRETSAEAAGDGEGEMVTDDSGFVTHIKGKRIF